MNNAHENGRERKRNPGITDAAIKAKAAESKRENKAIKMSDGNGLILLILPSGKKHWYFRYHKKEINQDGKTVNKEIVISIGEYGSIPLGSKTGVKGSFESPQSARDFQRKYANWLAAGEDPRDKLKELQEAEEAKKRQGIKTFKSVAEEYYNARREGPLYRERQLSESSYRSAMHTLKKHVLCGEITDCMGIGEVSARHIEAAIERTKKLPRTCSNTLAVFRRVLAYAKRQKLIVVNPIIGMDCADLLPLRPEPEHFPGPRTPEEIAEILRKVDELNRRNHLTMAALQLLPLLFCRPSELLSMKWSELKLEAPIPQWNYYVTKTKVNQSIPLPDQAVAILKGLRERWQGGDAVFPGAKGNGKLGRETVNRALREAWRELYPERYKEKEKANKRYKSLTTHGWRGCAMTMLAERGVAPSVIDSQLAHKPKKGVDSAYRHQTYFEYRADVLQFWADLLYMWKGGKITTIEDDAKYRLSEKFKLLKTLPVF